VKTKLFSNSVAVVLFALILFKVSSFHVYTHQDSVSDDIENCAICELAVENQNTEYVFTPPQTVQLPFINVNKKELATSYTVVVASSFLRFILFGRPPPALV